MTKQELTNMLIEHCRYPLYRRSEFMAEQHIMHARCGRLMRDRLWKREGWPAERYTELVRQGFEAYGMNSMRGRGMVLNAETAYIVRLKHKELVHKEKHNGKG